MSQTAANKPIGEQIVDTQRALAGPHPGFRPVHAKGIVCTGTFRASPDARRVCRAVHLQGQPISTIVRFSNVNGDPAVADNVPSVRALSVKFQLPGSAKTADILANSVDGFIARTPEEFLAWLQLQLPNPATPPDAVPKFLQSHPATQAFVDRLMQRGVPSSYAQASYHALHAFRFTNAAGESHFGRYHWSPQAGESFLSQAESAKRTPNFLREELTQRLLARERVAREPIVFALRLQLAASGDPTNDPTALWPEDRPAVDLGRLEISGISATGAADERRLVFDPANLTDGIELSDDPLLRVRSDAYSYSFDKRSAGA
jgi:catalase